MTTITCKERLERYLDAVGAPYLETPHIMAYTAQRLAEAEHLPGRSVAKIIVAESERGPLMLVVPATCRVDLDKAAVALGLNHLRLATEAEMARLFPDCEVGAMPPFGNLYKLPVYVDMDLTESREITFPAGTHRYSLTIAYADFARLARPIETGLTRD